MPVCNEKPEWKISRFQHNNRFSRISAFILNISKARDIGVRAPLEFGGEGGGDLIAGKKLHNAQKHVLHKRTQIAVKTKTVTILTSNERIIIPKLQLNPVRKIRYFEKSGVTKITVFD